MLSELPFPLRGWQSDCLAQQLAAAAAGGESFFVGAGVGTGKTTQALAFYMDGPFDLIIVVTPKTGISGSWVEDAEKMGLTLDRVVSGADFEGGNAGGSTYRMPNGYVLTSSMVPSVINDLRLLCANFRVLVVLDEAHHYGEDMTWTKDVQAGLSGAAFKMGLSGSPERQDGKRILLLRYRRDGQLAQGVPEYQFTTEQALAAGHVAPVITRFIGGSVTKSYVDGRSERYDYADGDYSHDGAGPDTSLMSTRLALSAVESFEWQFAGVREARRELMQFREDGHPWAGFIICREIQQAAEIDRYLRETYGDSTACIFDDANTVDEVARVNADPSITWVISISKVSEGISIKRLRVGLMLSNITTRNQFVQVDGRLRRLYPGVHHLQQDAVFLIPADPRLMTYAMEANQMATHVVRWLQAPKDDTGAEVSKADLEQTYRSETSEGDESHGTLDMEKLEDLRRRYHEAQQDRTFDAGEYTLYARARMDGALISEEYVSEDEYLQLRRRMAPLVGELSAMRMESDELNLLDQLGTEEGF